MKFYSKKIDDDTYGHFDSQTEFDYFKVLLKMQENGEIKDLNRQVVHLLIPSFKDSCLNTVQKMTYSSDFEYVDVATNRTVIVDCKGSEFCIDEKFKCKWKMLKYLQKDEPNIQYKIVIKYKDVWYNIEDKDEKKRYKTLHTEENKKKAERKAKREAEKKVKKTKAKK